MTRCIRKEEQKHKLERCPEERKFNVNYINLPYKYDWIFANDKSRNGQKSDLRRDNLITVLLRSNMETPHSLWQHAQIFDWIKKKQKYLCRIKYFSRDRFNLLTFFMSLRSLRFAVDILPTYISFKWIDQTSNQTFVIFFLLLAIQIKNVRILHR